MCATVCSCVFKMQGEFQAEPDHHHHMQHAAVDDSWPLIASMVGIAMQREACLNHNYEIIDT